MFSLSSPKTFLERVAAQVHEQGVACAMSFLQRGPNVCEALQRLAFVGGPDGYHPGSVQAGKVLDERPAEVESRGVGEHEEAVVRTASYSFRQA